MFLLVISFSLILFYIATTLLAPYSYWKKRGVCHINLLTILKRMLIMDKPYSEMIKEDYKKFTGKRYFGSYLSNFPVLVVRDIDLIKQMFVKDFEHFTDRLDIFNARSDPIFKKNLVAAKGKQWKRLRTTLSPAFSSSKMKAMFVLIEESARKFVDHFEAMDTDIIEMEMKEAFSKYANDVIASCAFGAECDSLKNPQNEIFLAGAAVNRTTPFKMLGVLFVILFPKLNKFLGLNVFPKKFSMFFKSIISSSIKTREVEGIIRPDLIHLLMEARKGKLHQENSTLDEVTGFATVSESNNLMKSETTLEITDEVITAQALIFFMAGYEASSTLLSFLSHELAINPDVQQKLIREIDEQLSGSERISFETVTNMKYLDQVVTEALRKWPSAFILFRKCTKEYTIKPQREDEAPLTLPRGSLTIIPSIAAHYDPMFFENPEAFIPERFSDENKKNVVPGSYIPFGIGPRNCIGSRFALLEVKCLVANILSKFEFQVTKNTNIPLKRAKNYALCIDGGVSLALKRRNK